jgi:hypothetical protein
VVYSPWLGASHAAHSPNSPLNWPRIIISDMYNMRERGLAQSLAAVVNSVRSHIHYYPFSDIASVGHRSGWTSGWVDK